MTIRIAGLSFVALTGLTVLGGCRADGDRPGTIVLPGMVESVPLDSYDANPVGRTGRPLLPPEGTVPVEISPFLYGPGPAEAERAGRELRIPCSETAAELARGKVVFDTICQVCHGPKGEGDGPIIGGPGRFPNPPSLLAPRAKSLPDGRIFHIVTRGQGIMPSHAAQVLPADRWRVIRYVRQLQGVAPPAGTAAAPEGKRP